MTRLEEVLARVAALFDERGQPWALVGGLAVSVRTEPRFTRDVGLALAVPDNATAEAMVYDLQSAG